MRRIAAWLLALLLFACLLTGCGREETVLLEQPENLYVADCAQVLSESTEAYVVSRTTALKEACGGEIAVVTVDFLNDLTAEEYAYTVFNQWGIGDRTKNNGMMLLLVIGENSCWLTPGYGIEDDFPSTQCTEFLRQYLWEYQNAGDCDTGVRNIMDALTSWYSNYYGIDIPGAENLPATDFVIESENDADGVLSGSGILTLLIIGFVIFLLIQNAERRSGYQRKRSYFVPAMLLNSLLNSQGGSYHSSSGGSHVGHSGGSSHVGHSGGFGGGGSHGGGGGFRG